MITREEAATYFRQLIGSKATWQKLASSQFVGHLSVFVSWCLREALWRLERLNQEFFISTAINDSSIMAHAEDREYIPRKRIPAAGTVAITNNGTARLSIASLTELISSDGLSYMTTDVVNLAPGETGFVPVEQVEHEVITQTVAAPTAFYTILFSKDQSQRLSSLKVEIDQNASGDFEACEYSRLFQNSFPNSAVYDEFFNHTGQTGIRFGNGLFGLIPLQNSVIKTTLTLTDGDTCLVSGQRLSPTGYLYDQSGNDAVCDILVQESIEGGSERESVVEMRANLHYWPTYNNKLVWDDDYEFFIKRNVPGINWVKCWGETEQEAESGLSVHNINRIFVTAYSSINQTVDIDIMAKLSEVHILNRHFQWVPPVFSSFALNITGKVARTTNIPLAISSILSVLDTNYGKDSAGRKKEVFLSEIYELINGTGYFSDSVSRFDVQVTGKTEATRLAEMISVDLNTTTVTLSYI